MLIITIIAAVFTTISRESVRCQELRVVLYVHVLLSPHHQTRKESILASILKPRKLRFEEVKHPFQDHSKNSLGCLRDQELGFRVQL